jgi:hypothetical protein
MQGPKANADRTAHRDVEVRRETSRPANDSTRAEVRALESGEPRFKRPLPDPVAEGPRRSARGEPPGANNVVRIGTIEVNVQPAASPPVVQVPAIERPPTPPLSRGYDSTFGLRQG